MRKNATPPTFPKLGVEDRRETLAVPKGGPQHELRAKLMTYHFKGVNGGATEEELDYLRSRSKKAKGLSFPHPSGLISFSTYDLSRPLDEALKSCSATEQHENWHNIMSAVEAKYGAPTRIQIAKHLLSVLPDHTRASVEQLHKIGWKQPKDPQWRAEEQIASVLSYLNDPHRRHSIRTKLAEEYPILLKRPPLLHERAVRHLDREIKKAYHIWMTYASKMTPSDPVMLGAKLGWEMHKSENLPSPPASMAIEKLQRHSGLAKELGKRFFESELPNVSPGDFPDKWKYRDAGPIFNPTQGQADVLGTLPNRIDPHRPMVGKHNVFKYLGGEGYNREDSGTTPLDEVMFHNLAHYVFGLGHFVPHTALVALPELDSCASVQERIPQDQILEPLSGESVNALAKHYDDIQKIRLMDHILGTDYDRHINNVIHTKDPIRGVHLHLIDNGVGVHRNQLDDELERVRHADYDGLGEGSPSHADKHVSHSTLEWLRSLDPQKLIDGLRVWGGHKEVDGSSSGSEYLARCYKNLTDAQRVAGVASDLRMRDLIHTKRHLEEAAQPQEMVKSEVEEPLRKYTPDGMLHYENLHARHHELGGVEEVESELEPLTNEMDKEAASHHLLGAPIAVHFTPRALKSWLGGVKRGKKPVWYNLGPVKQGAGAPNPWMRRDTERTYFGVNEDAPWEERPIYGAIHWGNNAAMAGHPFSGSEKGPCPWYGHLYATMKPHVKQRSTVTPHDSMDRGGPVGIADDDITMERMLGKRIEHQQEWGDISYPSDGWDLQDVYEQLHHLSAPDTHDLGSRIKDLTTVFDGSARNTERKLLLSKGFGLRPLKPEEEADSVLMHLWRNSHLDTSAAHYTEAQIWGGIDMAHDIEALHFADPSGKASSNFRFEVDPLDQSRAWRDRSLPPSLRGLIKLGKFLGVPVYWHNPMSHDSRMEFSPPGVKELHGMPLYRKHKLLRPPRLMWAPSQQMELFQKNLSEEYGSLVQENYGSRDAFERAFAAAAWMTGRVSSEHEKHPAVVEHETDPITAALVAFGLEPNEYNKESLLGVMRAQFPEQEFSKSSALAKAESIDATVQQMVANAIEAGMVEPLKLKTKHAKGASIAVDPRSGQAFFIKPDSKLESPAKGMQGGASLAHREAAFSEAAKAMGLGGAVADAALVSLDGEDAVAVKLYAGEFRNLDKIINKQGIDKVCEILNTHHRSGEIYRWATVDWLLGNVDRHAGNMMAFGDSIGLIDHGCTWAGVDFDPANDKNTFVPFYLRAWAWERFKGLSPAEKLNAIPPPTAEQYETLNHWIKKLPVKAVESCATRHGVDPAGFVARYKELEAAENPLLHVLASWCGAESTDLHKAESRPKVINPSESKSFRRYFYNSKMIDKDGKPKVFYRGVTRPSLAGLLPLQSFTDDPDIASIYSAVPPSTDSWGRELSQGGYTGDSGVYPVYLHMHNPLHLSPDSHQMKLSDMIHALKIGQPNGITSEEVGKFLNYMINRKKGKVKGGLQFNYRISPDPDSDYNEYEPDFDDQLRGKTDLHMFKEAHDDMMADYDRLAFDTYVAADWPRMKEIAQRLGHDGIIHGDVMGAAESASPRILGKPHTEIKGLSNSWEETPEGSVTEVPTHLTYRPFKEEQVKSVYNQGTFDPKNKDIGKKEAIFSDEVPNG